jgi:hypothetical protein
VPKRLCVEARCSGEVVYRGRCATHAKQRNREMTSQNKQVYNSKRWKILRRHKLFLTPLCEWEGCDEIAQDVHHRHAIQDGGAPWEMANLEALCHPHHSCLTRREQVGQKA